MMLCMRYPESAHRRTRTVVHLVCDAALFLSAKGDRSPSRYSKRTVHTAVQPAVPPAGRCNGISMPGMSNKLIIHGVSVPPSLKIARPMVIPMYGARYHEYAPPSPSLIPPPPPRCLSEVDSFGMEAVDLPFRARGVLMWCTIYPVSLRASVEGLRLSLTVRLLLLLLAEGETYHILLDVLCRRGDTSHSLGCPLLHRTVGLVGTPYLPIIRYCSQ